MTGKGKSGAFGVRHNLDRLDLGPSRENLDLNKLNLGSVG